MFQKTDSGWSSISSSPDRAITWTIAFDGRTIGEVGSLPDPGATSNPIDSGVQQLVLSGHNLPTIGAPSDQFAGLRAIWGTKVRRPLVVVSAPNSKDPDGWKRRIPSEKVESLARRAYRTDFPHVYKCDEEHPSQEEWHFPNSDIELTRVYTSNKGSFLVEIQLKNANCYIDDSNDPWANQWFFVDSHGSVRRIGGFLTLLDAGDYDGDGKSEVVFFLSQPEDTDGYVLYTADFRNRVALTWTYH
jgi:hypothetical protein